VVGGASAVLSRRAVAFLALAALLATYYSTVDSLWHWSLWPEVAWLDLVLIPAVFGLVGLALPLWRSPGTLIAGAACAALAFGFGEAGLRVPENFAKLAAATFVAWWFLSFFETLGWVVLVACIVPFVDAYSVWRGPTNTIVNKHPHTFGTLSFAFPAPGGHSVANLGLPDLLFFALFLASAARFGLRVLPTWIALVLSLGATMVIAVEWQVGGLPALPGLSIGFLAVNADLIRRQLRRP
jgi:hypothetical protein